MKFDFPAPKSSPRQDRKYKLFCSTCKKSQRMHFAPGGFTCPKCFTFRRETPRVCTGLVDNGKSSARNA